LKIALKIDVRTWRGTREGALRLVELLQARDLGATFLFTLGPDHTGRALPDAFRRGALPRLRRVSPFSQYGFKALLYGTLLPAPDIGAECADVMRRVRDAGFEVGIHAWDRVAWQRHAGGADAEWTRSQMQLACDRFEEILGEPARVHGAAGWQMNRHAYRLTQRLGFSYCSDTRGSGPFVPVYRAEIVACPQLPTTLPTLDEVAVAGVRPDDLPGHMLALTAEPRATGHVFTLQAELAGKRFLPAIERLLDGWRGQGHEIVSLQAYLESLELKDLPRHELADGEVPGRTGALALQGREFLAGA
jgi:peptidoglycan/xylan/chitin deacetylase (PgdA/CDA1 family)